MLEVAKTLLSHGAPVNSANVNGETALIFASQTCIDGKMVQVLLEAGAGANARSNEAEPL
jgi:ankyrin repeat protein